VCARNGHAQTTLAILRLGAKINLKDKVSLLKNSSIALNLNIFSGATHRFTAPVAAVIYKQ
jgi:hypothetical protein